MLTAPPHPGPNTRIPNPWQYSFHWQPRGPSKYSTPGRQSQTDVKPVFHSWSYPLALQTGFQFCFPRSEFCVLSKMIPNFSTPASCMITKGVPYSYTKPCLSIKRTFFFANSQYLLNIGGSLHGYTVQDKIHWKKSNHPEPLQETFSANSGGC